MSAPEAGGRAGAAAARGDGGFAAVEVVLLAPVLVAVLLLVVAAGRTQDASVRVGGAARDGARAASLERTAQGAQTAAAAAVRANLSGQSMGCAGGPVTTVDTSAFTPGGLVRVRVRCTSLLTDVAFPGVPGRVVLDRDASSPVETYRGAS